MTLRDIVTRRAEERDADAIAQVHDAGWREGYRGIVPDDVLATRTLALRRRQWRDWLAGEQPDGDALVAEIDGEVVGFAAYECRADDDPELRTLYVLPSRWRAGVGRAIVAAVVRELRARGASHAVLWTFAGNTRGRRFYEALGWHPDGGEGEWEGIPTVRYRRSLA